MQTHWYSFGSANDISTVQHCLLKWLTTQSSATTVTTFYFSTRWAAGQDLNVKTSAMTNEDDTLRTSFLSPHYKSKIIFLDVWVPKTLFKMTWTVIQGSSAEYVTAVRGLPPAAVN